MVEVNAIGTGGAETHMLPLNVPAAVLAAADVLTWMP